VPVLVHFGGSRLALLGVAAVLPLAAAAGGHALFSLDAPAPIPVVHIALLRSIPLVHRTDPAGCSTQLPPTADAAASGQACNKRVVIAHLVQAPVQSGQTPAFPGL
jgi:hypothetical protein